MPKSVSPSARSLTLLCAGAVLLGSGACAPAGDAEEAAPAEQAASVAAEPQAGWQTLFDGKDLSQWRGFKREDVPGAWKVEDGTLALTQVQDRAQRGDLITRDQYGDFELELEWKISEGGNSGIIYRSTEEGDASYVTGPEMQVLDNERHADGKLPSHRAGALYDLIVPGDNIAKPVGEWNQARLVVQGNHIQQWLNGNKTADIVIGSDEWNKLLAASKFAEMPLFATRPRGHIVLQDHGDRVWYRNIRVRPLAS